jgi:hypothetical protein
MGTLPRKTNKKDERQTSRRSSEQTPPPRWFLPPHVLVGCWVSENGPIVAGVIARIGEANHITGECGESFTSALEIVYGKNTSLEAQNYKVVHRVETESIT